MVIKAFLFIYIMLRSLFFLLTAFSASHAYEASPVPGGQRDGGRDVVNIEVFTLDEAGASVELTRGHVEVPAAGMSAYYAMKRSSIPFSTTEMVSQNRVRVEEGRCVARAALAKKTDTSIPASTGLSLSHFSGR